ncbi:hypothetical protein [Streptomyces zaomyceticus]|uniref:hypothetical protein n=1 Tax=Streptomyces zaomyceticus TaxID=68286 RepID=UPI002E1A0FF5
MSRKIMAAHGAVYRAVIHWTEPAHKGGATHVEYEGPYGEPGAAQARVTFWENYLRDDESGESRAAGHVEEGVVPAWTTYTPPVKKRRKGGRA